MECKGFSISSNATEGKGGKLKRSGGRDIVNGKYFNSDEINRKRKRSSIDGGHLSAMNYNLGHEKKDMKVFLNGSPLPKRRKLLMKKSSRLRSKRPRRLSNPFNIPWMRCLPIGVLGDSEVEGKRVFQTMMQPIGVEEFFENIWEKMPLLLKRHNFNFNKGLFSTQDLDMILRREHLNFSENIDVVTYIDNKRETHNPEGRAIAAVVWDFYQQGCSIRLLNPQTYSKKVWRILSLLQEFFGCMAGANVYLTPSGTQGFAPHWDDIEAFIIQLEGKKHWKVYAPRSEEEVLPMFSSSNFTSADLGDPVLEATLNAGDLLYFPKGFIHQGNTGDDSHSLHITISVGQRNTWGDFLKMVLPRALEVAMEEDVEFRKSLPRNYLSFMGLSFYDQKAKSPDRKNFIKTVKGLFNKIWSHAPLDSAADQMAKSYLETSLPPCLTDGEKRLSVFGQGEIWNPKLKKVVELAEIQPETMVRIIRRGSLRLMSEEKVCIYHNMENARVYKGSEFKCIEIEDEEADAVEFLINAYPKFVQVDELPQPSLEEQINVARLLYDKGLLMTKQPLTCFDDDERECSDCSCCHEVNDEKIYASKGQDESEGHDSDEENDDDNDDDDCYGETEDKSTDSISSDD